MYLKTDSNLYINYPEEGDFENTEDNLAQAVHFQDGVEKDRTYLIKEVIYFNTKYDENASAKLKYEDILDIIFVYLLKSIMRDIKINRKLNKNYYNEKLTYNGIKCQNNIKNIIINIHSH